MENCSARQRSYRAKYINFHYNSFLKVTKDREALAKALTCPVCDQLFTRPYILPCGHSICYSCVTRMTEKEKKTNPDVLTNHLQIKCPVCDFNLTIEDYMENAPRNRAVENAVGSLINIFKNSTPCKTSTPVKDKMFHVNDCAAGGDGGHMEGCSGFICASPILPEDNDVERYYNTPILQRESPILDKSSDLLCVKPDETGNESLDPTEKDEISVTIKHVEQNSCKGWKIIKTPRELIRKMISKIRERRKTRKFKSKKYTLIFNEMEY